VLKLNPSSKRQSQFHHSAAGASSSRERPQRQFHYSAAGAASHRGKASAPISLLTHPRGSEPLLANVGRSSIHHSNAKANFTIRPQGQPPTGKRPRANFTIRPQGQPPTGKRPQRQFHHSAAGAASHRGKASAPISLLTHPRGSEPLLANVGLNRLPYSVAVINIPSKGD
jgi:hypothetical protein